MNRRNVLRSLLTLPVAATTIERSQVQAVQGDVAPAAMDECDEIGITDFSGGRKVYVCGPGKLTIR